MSRRQRRKFPVRYCEDNQCRKYLIRKPNETTSNFARRRFCDRSCACVLGRRIKGTHPPKHEVKCSVPECQTILLRAVHLVDAKCPSCRKREHRKRENAANAKHTIECRRYRVLMHLMGYEDDHFAELLEEIRGSYLALRRKPGSWRARLDLKLERRHLRGVA